MIVLNGKLLSEEIQLSLKNKINSLLNIVPGLGVILVGNREDSMKYVNAKKKACENIGINFFLKEFNDNISEGELIHEIETMNNNSKIHGILVQLPLPDNLKEYESKILNTISVNKDVDGFHIINAGKLFLNRERQFVPCTPLGCMELLDHYHIDIEGLNTVIIGSSNIVGLPLSIMLLQRGATVTICHIKTKDVKEHTKKADLVISCCGVPHLVKNDWLKEGVVVIDIGTNTLDGKLVGDVDFLSVKDKCKYITPVPGGVGPMTIAMLLKQVVEATERFSKL